MNSDRSHADRLDVSLPVDAPNYVVNPIDQELNQALEAGDLSKCLDFFVVNISSKRLE